MMKRNEMNILYIWAGFWYLIIRRIYINILYIKIFKNDKNETENTDSL
jgi:hypothetical protein